MTFALLTVSEAFSNALQQANDQGYLASEYCTPVLRNHTIAGIEEIDRGTSLALRYMKRLVHNAGRLAMHSVRSAER